MKYLPLSDASSIRRQWLVNGSDLINSEIISIYEAESTRHLAHTPRLLEPILQKGGALIENQMAISFHSVMLRMN